MPVSYPIRTISPHLVRAFQYIKDAGDWLTSEQIAKGANIASISARYLALKLTREGLLERSQGALSLQRYRLAKGYEQRDLAKKIAAKQSRMHQQQPGRS